MTRDRVYLIHIRESIRLVREFTKDGKTSFLADPKTQNAVMYSLQTLAESTQRLSEEAKLLQPEIDWVRIAGFRNVAVHAYLNIDLETIWKIVESELDPLEQTITEMARSEGLD